MNGEKMKDSSNSSTTSSRLTDPAPGANAGNNGSLTFQENKWVSYSKVLVVFVVLLATIVGAIETYRFTTKGEQHNFEVRVSTIVRDPSVFDPKMTFLLPIRTYPLYLLPS